MVGARRGGRPRSSRLPSRIAVLLVGCLYAYSTVPNAGSPGEGQLRGAQAAPSEGFEEEVTFYPTYGYRVGDEWIIPLRLRVHEERSWLEAVVSRIAESVAGLSPGEVETFRQRIDDFVTDSESGEVVTFVFEGDPVGREYWLKDTAGASLRTDLHGVAEGFITLPDDRAQEFRSVDGSNDGWRTIRATSDEHQGSGRVRLVEPTGLSVISDIDDTVKITGIPAGAHTVVKKTFFEEWEAVPDMVELFRDWEEDEDNSVAFHFVSTGPWQLSDDLADFLFGKEVGFPEATFHMRAVRKHPLSIRTWVDLYTFVTDEDAGYRHKVDEVSRILERFPERRFILVGDSGQADPEAYRTVRERFPEQVEAVVIRDVVDAQDNEPERLRGMTVIHSGTTFEAR